MDYTIKKLTKNVTEIVASLKRAAIAKEEEVVFENLRRDLKVEGFRKGKAPAAVAKKHLSADKITEKAIQKLIGDLYGQIIKKTGLKPIVQPKITLLESKPKTDWKVKFTIAEKPTIDLGDYKKKIKKAKAGIVKDKSKKEDKSLNVSLETLLKTAKIEIADLVVEDELNRRLSALVDDVRRIGLTIDKYARSKNTTVDKIKEDIKKQIIDTYKIEFLLAEIADREKIVVDQKEIDKLFSQIKDEKERKTAQANAYHYASVLRKQKTLDFLKNL